MVSVLDRAVDGGRIARRTLSRSGVLGVVGRAAAAATAMALGVGRPGPALANCGACTMECGSCGTCQQSGWWCVNGGVATICYKTCTDLCAEGCPDQHCGTACGSDCIDYGGYTGETC